MACEVEWIPLGDIVNLSSGGTPDKKQPAYWDGEIPWISAKTLTGDTVTTSNLFITEEGLHAGSKLAPVGSILLLTRGSGLFKRIPLAIVNAPVAYNQDVKCMTSKVTTITNEYVFFALKALSPELTNMLETTGIGAGKLATDRLLDMPIPVLSHDEREKAVSFFSALSRKIMINNRINDYLLDLLKSSAKNLYLKHEKNIQEKLPSGWRWVSIGEIADMVCRGIAPKYSLESDEIILGQTCIRNNLVLTENGRSHAPKKLTDKWLRKYDLLINSTGVGSLGRTAQVWFEPSKLVVDSHVTIVRATDKKNALYLGSWAFEHERYIESLHTGSTGQTELPRDRVKAIRVVLPDAGTLDEFNAIAEPSVKMIVANQEENKRLIEIRDTLLPKLMSGAIDVSKVDLTQLTNNHLSDC
jgi:type I restriction enzyme S subunit